MPRPITLKIDVSKIDKAHLFKGAKGTYLDVAIWPNKEGAGQYGDTHYAVQQVTKELRESGVRGPIIGNATVPSDEAEQAKPTRHAKTATPTDPDSDIAPDDLPF
tara:strand:- start:151 stop:465 length:315 start_codon:yes stop_codon:yes gene_type:complete